MAGLTRTFGGKLFRFSDSYQEKKEATDMAKQLQMKGKRFRITHPKHPLLPYFELWVRN